LGSQVSIWRQHGIVVLCVTTGRFKSGTGSCVVVLGVAIEWFHVTPARGLGSVIIEWFSGGSSKSALKTKTTYVSQK